MEKSMLLLRKNIPSVVLGALSVSLLACATLLGAPATPRLPPPTEPPLPTSSPEPIFTPTPEALLLDQTVFITTEVISETNSAPLYTLHAETPVLQSSDDPRVTHFNAAVAALVQEEVAAFKQAAPEALDTPEGSSFDLSFAIISPPGDLVSLQFRITGYSAGAAHPYHYTRTFNYQLSTGQELTLAQLFLPGADYLKVIADYCRAELQQRLGDDFFVDGADPKPENYQNWNLSSEGLIITFDEYQVAPYAAGPQTVTIPYATLEGVVDPQGPVAVLEQ
jgi:hypothetical protein